MSTLRAYLNERAQVTFNVAGFAALYANLAAASWRMQIRPTPGSPALYFDFEVSGEAAYIATPIPVVIFQASTQAISTIPPGRWAYDFGFVLPNADFERAGGGVVSFSAGVTDADVVGSPTAPTGSDDTWLTGETIATVYSAAAAAAASANAAESAASAAAASAASAAFAAEFTRTPIANDYNVLTTDRMIAVTALTGAINVLLCSAASYPTGRILKVIDESGAASVVNTVTVVAIGSDLINGQTIAIIPCAFGYVQVESNGANKWTIVGMDLGSTVAALPMASGTPDAMWNNGGVVQQS